MGWSLTMRASPWRERHWSRRIRISSENLGALPAGTPVIVPTIAGLSAKVSAVTDPNQVAWIGVLDKLVESAQQASNAQATGVGTPRPTSSDAQRSKALTLLREDIAQFKKLHTS